MKLTDDPQLFLSKLIIRRLLKAVDCWWCLFTIILIWMITVNLFVMLFELVKTSVVSFKLIQKNPSFQCAILYMYCCGTVIYSAVPLTWVLWYSTGTVISSGVSRACEVCDITDSSGDCKKRRNTLSRSVQTKRVRKERK